MRAKKGEGAESDVYVTQCYQRLKVTDRHLSELDVWAMELMLTTLFKCSFRIDSKRTDSLLLLS